MTYFSFCYDRSRRLSYDSDFVVFLFIFIIILLWRPVLIV